MARVKISIGTVIHDLRIKKILGKGRYGDVYLAYPKDDVDEKRPVCLKYCESKLEAEQEVELGYSYFERRESIFPGQLTILDKDYDKIISHGKGYVCIIPYVSGHTLEQYLKMDELAIDKLLNIANAFLEQIIIDKSVSQLHRDTHTENLMVFEDPRSGKISVVLIDFGLAVNTNTDPTGLSYRPIFDAVLKIGFLSSLAMKIKKYAQRIAPEHQTIQSTSNVGFRSESFSVGYIFSVILAKIDFIIENNQAKPTHEQQENINKLRVAVREMRKPNIMERMSLEEAFLLLADDEIMAISRLNELMGTQERVIVPSYGS